MSSSCSEATFQEASWPKRQEGCLAETQICSCSSPTRSPKVRSVVCETGAVVRETGAVVPPQLVDRLAEEGKT